MQGKNCIIICLDWLPAIPHHSSVVYPFQNLAYSFTTYITQYQAINIKVFESGVGLRDWGDIILAGVGDNVAIRSGV